MVLIVLVVVDFSRRYKDQLAQYEARKQREEYLRPLSSVAGRRQAGAALATSPRPVKKRRK
jgi:hypothetical protein